MITITPKISCPACHGDGYIEGDWVDYGSTKTQLPSDFCDCVFEQLPEDYDGDVEISKTCPACYDTGYKRISPTILAACRVCNAAEGEHRRQQAQA